MKNILAKAVLLAAAVVLGLAPMAHGQAQTTYTSDANVADFTAQVSSYGEFTNFNGGDKTSPYTPAAAQVAAGDRVYGGGTLAGLSASNNWVLVTFASPVSSIWVFPNIDHYGSPYDGYQYQIWGSNDQVCWTPLFDALTVNGSGEPFTLGTFAGTAPSQVNNVETPGAGPGGVVGYEALFNFPLAYKYYAFGASSVAIAQGNADQEFSAVGAVGVTPQVAAPAALVEGSVTSCDANFKPSTLSSGLSGPSGLVYRHPTNDLVVAQNASSVVSTIGTSSGSVSPFTGAPPASPFDVAVRASDGLVAVLNEAAGQISFYNSAGSQQGTLTISTITNAAYSCGAGLAFDTSGNLYVGAGPGPANAVVGLAAASASPGTCQTTGWSVLEFPGPNPWLDNANQWNTAAGGLTEIGGLAFTAFPPTSGSLYAVSSSEGTVYQIVLGAPVPVAAGAAAVAQPQDCVPAGAVACSATTVATVSSAVDPRGIALDPLTGDIFISQFSGNVVYRIPAGTTMITNFASGFGNSVGLAFDTTGNLYICDYNAGIIYKFSRASNATVMVPLTSGSPNTFTFTNPAMSDQYQTITIPASANLGGAAYLQEIFAAVSPATLNATLSQGSPGDLVRFGGSPVPAGTLCVQIPSANYNCVVTIQVCYDANRNPYAICPVQVLAGPDLIQLTSKWAGPAPLNPGLVIDYDSDPSGQAATNITTGFSPDPAPTGGSRGLCSKTIPVSLGPVVGPDFSFSTVSPSPIPLFLNGSNTATVQVNSIHGFNSPVTLGTSNVPTGVMPTFSANPVTPQSGMPAISTLTVTVAPYITPTPAPAPISFFVSGTGGPYPHSANAYVTVTASSASIESVVDAFQAAGCFKDSEFSGAMNNKLSSAQSAIAGGDSQTGVNTLGAFDDQDEDDGGRHINSTCTIGGYTFNPVQVLHIDIKSLINSFKTVHATPVTGYVLNSSNVAVPGAVVSIYLGSQKVASTVTDITGFYFFGRTSILKTNSTYTVKITYLPKPYSVVTPSQQTFTWQNAAPPLMNFAVR